jgi:hypothetical protein
MYENTRLENGSRFLPAGTKTAFPLVILFVLALLLSACNQFASKILEQFGGGQVSEGSAALILVFANGTAESR